MLNFKINSDEIDKIGNFTKEEKNFRLKNSISIHNLSNIDSHENIPWITPLKLLKNLITSNANNEMQSSIKFGRRVKLTHSKNSTEL